MTVMDVQVHSEEELNPTEVALLTVIEVRNAGTNGCILCGLCTELCPWEAPIIIEKEILVRQDRCRGCGVCVAACPKMAINMRVYGTEELLDLIRFVLKEESVPEYPATAFDMIHEVEQALMSIERILSHRGLDNDLEGRLKNLKRIIERIGRTETRFRKESEEISQIA